MSDTSTNEANDYLKLIKLEVTCGTENPQTASLMLQIGDKRQEITSTGDGPVDATFNAVKNLFLKKVLVMLDKVVISRLTLEEVQFPWAL